MSSGSMTKTAPFPTLSVSAKGQGMSSVGSGKNFGFRSEKVLPDGAGLAGFLRAKHPRDTVFWVSSLTGIGADTVAAWLSGKCLPQLRHFGPLIGIYGPPLIKAVFPAAPGWLDDAVRQERINELEAEAETRAAELRALRGE